ncbi:MoaD/ThiS family protein [Brachybacterium phenoliresistens]|uniref:Thiamine biosynthesis protein ThiS n=1 Tax=Brachybacterium phenoliresistens TaxID=396014 RepID=Z9JVR3_9MICO|nr:MoaD/ThiS family protein [Brachybacterium phenoliresistens]EWS81886.1 thiamine biosynthesis protein ThiS [Brachybacterium phenoliresistens]
MESRSAPVPGPGTGASLPEIEVHLFAAVAAALGAERMLLRAGTVDEALGQLRAATDAPGARVLDSCSLLVNSVVCRDRTRALAPGDRVDVLPPFAGG